MPNGASFPHCDGTCWQDQQIRISVDSMVTDEDHFILFEQGISWFCASIYAAGHPTAPLPQTVRQPL